MENYPPPPEEDDPMAAEEDSVLRFWESPPRDIHELLRPLPGVSNEVLQTSENNPPPDQNVGPVVYNRSDGTRNIDGGGGGPTQQPAAPGAASGGDGGNANVATPPQIPGWEIFSEPDCTTTCGVLREVIHANDTCRAKLSIHGGQGFFSHAVLVLHHLQSQMADDRYIMDLRYYDWKSVTQFLENYGRGRYQEGQILIDDTHQPFYDALSVNMDPTDTFLSGGTREAPRRRSAAPSRRLIERGESSSSQTNRKSDKGKRGGDPTLKEAHLQARGPGKQPE